MEQEWSHFQFASLTMKSVIKREALRILKGAQQQFDRNFIEIMDCHYFWGNTMLILKKRWDAEEQFSRRKSIEFTLKS